jgi:hypothetical protein
MTPISRDAADRLGLKRYFTGEPCIHGHIAERATVNCMCLACAKQRSRNRRSANPELERQKLREWREKNPKKTAAQRQRTYRRTFAGRARNWKRHGINIEGAVRALESHGGRCESCGSGHVSRKKIGWIIDHDHSSGRIRGVICNSCNVILGMARDSSEHLQKVIAYLARTGQ